MQYDLAGRRTRLTWADGFFVNYDHLVTGEMKSIVENGSVTLIAFDYDGLGRRTWLHRANGTNVQYDYDAASRLHVMAHNLGGTSADLQNYMYYNPAGQIISQSRTVDAFAWTGHGSGTTNQLHKWLDPGNYKGASIGGDDDAQVDHFVGCDLPGRV